MSVISSEKTIFNYIRTRPDLIKWVPIKFFNNEDIRLIYKITSKFYKKTLNVPSSAQIKLLIENSDTLELDEDIVDMIFNEDLSQLDLEDLHREVQTWIEYNTLIKSFEESVEIINSTEVSSDTIKDLKTKVKDLIQNRNSINMDFQIGLDFFNPEDHVQNLEDTFSSGYPWIDKCLGGGYKKKRLYVFMGPQKKGKSIWLCNMAVNAVRLGHNTALISLEMGSDEFMMRLGANAFNIKMDDYPEMSRNSEFMKKKIDKFKKGSGNSLVPPGHFTVQEFGSSTLSVPDLEEYLKQVEETKGIKLELVVVDYINIMKNWRNQNSENTYMKIKQISEDLRAMAKRNEWVIVSATQTNRLEDESKMLAHNNISESIGLISTVDAMFGINQDSIDKLNNRYYLNPVALRSSKISGEKKEFKIEYDYMRLTETLEEPINYVDTSVFSDENHRNKKKQLTNKGSDSSNTDKSFTKSPTSPPEVEDFFN